MPIRYTLGANERLKRMQHIETLFRTGKAFSVFPLRVIYTLVPRGNEEFPCRAGFSVSKKKFKKAVDRNHTKRRMREAWRLQKHELTAIPEGQQLHLFLIYTAPTLPDYPVIAAAVGKAISQLGKQLGQLAVNPAQEELKATPDATNGTIAAQTDINLP